MVPGADLLGPELQLEGVHPGDLAPTDHIGPLPPLDQGEAVERGDIGPERGGGMPGGREGEDDLLSDGRRGRGPPPWSRPADGAWSASRASSEGQHHQSLPAALCATRRRRAWSARTSRSVRSTELRICSASDWESALLPRGRGLVGRWAAVSAAAWPLRHRWAAGCAAAPARGSTWPRRSRGASSSASRNCSAALCSSSARLAVSARDSSSGQAEVVERAEAEPGIERPGGLGEPSWPPTGSPRTISARYRR